MAQIIKKHIKDPGSAITHFIGMLMAIFAAVPLLIKAAHEPSRIYIISITAVSYTHLGKVKEKLGTAETAETVNEEQSSKAPKTTLRLFSFATMDYVLKAARLLSTMYSGSITLYLSLIHIFSCMTCCPFCSFPVKAFGNIFAMHSYSACSFGSSL